MDSTFESLFDITSFKILEREREMNTDMDGNFN